MISRHPLNQSFRGGAAIADADVVLGLEVANFFGAVNSFRDQVERSTKPVTKPGVKLITITAGELNIKANYQDFQRYTEVDLALAYGGKKAAEELEQHDRRQQHKYPVALERVLAHRDDDASHGRREEDHEARVEQQVRGARRAGEHRESPADRETRRARRHADP